MNVKLKIWLILFFLLVGFTTVVYAAGRKSSSWGAESTDSQGTVSVSQEASSSDLQENSLVSQAPAASELQEKPLVYQELNSNDLAEKPASPWGEVAKYMQKNPSISLYDQGMEADKSGDYQKAKMLFEQALSIDKSNPDILNMLAHTQLKVGLIDESLDNYKKALELRPKFPEAREYLGEAYLQGALREIEALKNYGAEGKEQLEDLVKKFKEAAGTI